MYSKILEYLHSQINYERLCLIEHIGINVDELSLITKAWVKVTHQDFLLKVAFANDVFNRTNYQLTKKPHKKVDYYKDDSLFDLSYCWCFHIEVLPKFSNRQEVKDLFLEKLFTRDIALNDYKAIDLYKEVLLDL
jgi:hypothetical protein